MLARRLTPLRFQVRGETVEATLFDARLGSAVELVVIDIPGLFDATLVEDDAPHSARRAGLFCRALAELCDKREKSGRPFVLPFLLREREVRTVLTVHDAARQGRFPKDAIEEVGLSWDDYHPAGLEFFGDVNYLKAGILSADVVTAPSPGYAEDLRSGRAGVGLDGVFRARGDDFVGVSHGIDYATWSPATDPQIAARFDAEDVGNKGRCKASLLYELDLALEPERPLLVALGPIGERYGSDVLAAALGELVRADVHVVVAGVGDEALAARLDDAASSLPGDALVLGAVSEPLAHRLVAAADGILLPWRHAPTAQLAMVGQRYGAAPIAHAVGALRDGIVDADAQVETGSGFLFDELTPRALAGAVQRAVAAMRSERWGSFRRRAMRLDVSWERPARRYARLYQAP
jgi:starch synthase